MSWSNEKPKKPGWYVTKNKQAPQGSQYHIVEVLCKDKKLVAKPEGYAETPFSEITKNRISMAIIGGTMTLEELEAEIQELKESSSWHKKQIDMLEATVNLMQQPQAPKLERWKFGGQDEAHFYINSNGFACAGYGWQNASREIAWENFNSFPNQQEAEKEALRTRARRKLEWLARELNKGKQEGSCLFFLCADNSLLARSVPSIGEIYFYGKADAEYALSQMTLEELEALR